jgi:hypothetical protein
MQISTVKHSLRFINDLSGVHTYTIEGLRETLRWHYVKSVVYFYHTSPSLLMFIYGLEDLIVMKMPLKCFLMIFVCKILLPIILQIELIFNFFIGMSCFI